MFRGKLYFYILNRTKMIFHHNDHVLHYSPVTGSCLVYCFGDFIKGFASSPILIFKDSVDKAKEWIDEKFQGLN